MNKVSSFVRIITIPPVFAVLLLVITFVMNKAYIGSLWNVVIGVLTLTVLPSLAYPLQRYIKPFKDKGRDGQRTLAMIFSFIGYLAGTVLSYIMSAPTELKIIYYEYLFCGVAILILNKVFKIKASGHACGIVGPVLVALYFKMYISALIGACLVIPVYISSIKTKRHTSKQLIVGSIIPAVVLILIHLIKNIFF